MTPTGKNKADVVCLKSTWERKREIHNSWCNVEKSYQKAQCDTSLVDQFNAGKDQLNNMEQ